MESSDEESTVARAKNHVRRSHLTISSVTSLKPTTLMETKEIAVPFPLLWQFTIARRFTMEDGDRFISVSYNFYPPDDTNLWPKTIADIPRTTMEEIFEEAGHDPIGSKYLCIHKNY